MYSIYTARGQRIKMCRSLQEAASHVATLGVGATIRRDGVTVWTEGPDGETYALGYETVERLIKDRLTHRTTIA
tara:strand:+ start:326 stop:547 length:222 start_codon:yes stop_codon:yes gene_type:complete